MFGQVEVIDLGTMAADIVYHKEQYSSFEEIRNNELKIAALQAAVKEQTLKITEIEREMYRSLKKVEDVIKQGKGVLNAYRKLEKLGRYVVEIGELVGDNPALLIIANKTEAALKDRMISLVEYLGLAMTGGNVNLMNNADRTKLIYHVNAELNAMTGLCWRIKFQMERAVQTSIMQEAIREYFYEFYFYHRRNEAIAERILGEFHF